MRFRSWTDRSTLWAPRGRGTRLFPFVQIPGSSEGLITQLEPWSALGLELSFFFFSMWTIFKVFIEFVTTLLLLYVLVFCPQGLRDFRAACTHCIGRWHPSHRATSWAPCLKPSWLSHLGCRAVLPQERQLNALWKACSFLLQSPSLPVFVLEDLAI